MREFIYQWVIIILTSSITLTLFESLLPNDEIKKTCMFVGRLIFVISVLIPVVGLINNGWSVDLWQSYYEYSIEMKEDVFESSDFNNEVQQQLIENLYYENTVNLIENYVNHIPGIVNCKADVILDKSQDGSTYGMIRKIVVSVSYDKTKTKKPTTEQIQFKISEYFEVDSEYVYVSVM
ncbi:MAG TPA: hypothetical protein DDZ89_18645 [Clostridiales bacterium]|nr:hypothetical protein [Clostridiales bacterium]